MNEICGKTIMGLSVSEDEHYLVFHYADGTFDAYEVDGDCCSESWFADIVGVSALIGGKVLEVAEVDMPQEDKPDNRCRQEYDSFYGVKIRTDKGYADIVYRNSSNSYYGGSVFHHSKLPERDTYTGNKLVWKGITDDWQA